MTQRHIVYAPLAALVPADVNPKLHDQPAIIASLESYGFTEPALLDERTGQLSAGHGRREALIAMKEMGMPPPSGIYVDDDGDWLMPIVRGWASRDDTEAAAYLVASNQLTIAGGWHMKSLSQLLGEVVTDAGHLMDSLGFTSDDIDDLLRRTDGTGLDALKDDPWGDDDKPETKKHDEDGAADLDTEEAKAEARESTDRTHTCPGCGFEFTDA